MGETSIGLREAYEDNLLYLSDHQPSMKMERSMVTTVSPRLGFDFAPRFGSPDALNRLSLVYHPDFVTYHSDPAESFAAHRFTNSIAGKSGDFSYSVANGVYFIDGPSQGPRYVLPSGAKQDYSVFATGFDRERRQQIQGSFALAGRYDREAFFLRPAANLLYWDMMTDWKNNGAGLGTATPGYINYVDRADVNGGLDGGLKVAPELALTLGYRYGHQYQQAFPAEVNTLAVRGRQAQSSSDYQRALVGIEGRPWDWLSLNLRGGPDFRNYNAAAPVDDRNPTVYYVEGTVAATLATNQSISLTFKHWQWESSIGRLPYVENTCCLLYHWSTTERLGLDLSGRFSNQDYNPGSPTLTKNASLRNDACFSFGIAGGYRVTSNLNVSAGYTYDIGRNLQDNVATAAYRAFDHQLLYAGVKLTF